MNRRRFLIALAVLVPLGMFGAAKWTARFRPTRIGPLMRPGPGWTAWSAQASPRYLLAGDGHYTLFDLQTGARRAAPQQGVVGQGAWLYSFVAGKPVRLALSDGGAGTRQFVVPDTAMSGQSSAVLWDAASRNLRVVAQRNCVELLWSGTLFCRWNLRSGQLERRATLLSPAQTPFNGQLRSIAKAVSRDGERVIQAIPSVIETLSTRDGAVMRRVPVQDVRSTGKIQMSSFGSYALYENSSGSHVGSWRVVETASGRTLWNFKLDQIHLLAPLTPDEREIALPQVARQQWELRDLASGALRRTLPLVPDARVAVFSPDGATLYSVAGGVLYRQRAR